MLSANCQIDHRLSGRSKTKRGGEESGYGSEFDEKLGEHRVNVQPFSTLFLRMRACFFFLPRKYRSTVVGATNKHDRVRHIRGSIDYLLG